MIIQIFIAIVTGVLLGYVTSARTASDGLEDLTRNVLVGVVGGFIGLKLMARTFDSGDTGVSSVALIIGSVLGAALLLFVVNRVRRA